MTSGKRQRMSAEARRDQILDTTRELVDREGFHAATIERIAQECGVTRTLIYQQFTTLAGLLVAMVDREFLHAGAGFLQAVVAPAPVSAEERFKSALAGVLAAVDTAPASWRMFLMPSEGGPPELYVRLREAQAVTRAFLSAALEDTPIPSGLADKELTIRLLHALGDELVRLRLQDPERYSIARLLAQAERVSRALLASNS